MYLPRTLTDTIKDKLSTTNMGVVLYGARQVGKTTLVSEVIKSMGLKTLVVNGDQAKYVDVLSSRDLTKIKDLVGGYELLFVDEAQRIPEIGLNLKIILDNLPWLKVIATGSSSLDLASKIAEPLTGRVWTYRLHAISTLELSRKMNSFELAASLEERMVYGSYPKLLSLEGREVKREYLQNVSDAYLYKDLLELGGLKNSAKIRALLKLVAFQVGSQVSLMELGGALDMSKDTVARYIDFLEKSFVLFRLSGFNRNLRKEVTKMDKIYFYDIGIRNILIDNLKPLKDRNDVGALWENFIMVERMKKTDYTHRLLTKYFWRIYTGSELDLIEEEGGKLSGFEFKYSEKTSLVPKSWLETYSGSTFVTINKSNWIDFVT